MHRTATIKTEIRTICFTISVSTFVYFYGKAHHIRISFEQPQYQQYT